MAFATRTVIFIEMLAFGIGTFLYVAVVAREYNRVLIFKEPVEGKILQGHVIRTEKVANEGNCRVKCFLKPNCVSINVGPADDQGQRICELNDLTDESPLQTGLTEKAGHIHYSAENICHSNPCTGGNFICQVGFRAKRYRCICRDGFKGENCDEDINECRLDTGCGVSKYPPTAVSSAPDTSTASSSATQSDASSSEPTVISTAVPTASPASTKQPSQQACQPGWIGSGTSCYKFFTSSKTWENAKEECEKWHAGLVKVESPEESEFIKTNVLPTSGRDIYWIGLSDSANEDNWMWTDETQLDSQGYTNWGSGQPDNVDNQDCVLVRIRESGKDYYGKWYDRRCSDREKYICEKPNHVDIVYKD